MRVPAPTRDRGAVIPLVALLLPVIVLMTAFAVDLGRQRASARTMQARADVIALDMVRLADGRSSRVIFDDSQTTAELHASATRNDTDPSRIIEVVWGTYDSSVEPLPFVPHHAHGVAPPDDPLLIPDAVLVRTRESTDYFFTSGSGEVTRTAIATLDHTPVGSFSLGSSLARLDAGQSALLNPLLSRLLGNQPVTLSGVDYQGLVGANVTVRNLIEADPTVGSVDELLSSSMSLGRLADVFLEALTNRGELTAAQVDTFRDLATLAANTGTPSITVGDILGVAPDNERALDTDVNAFDLFLAGAQAANRNNFIDLSFDVPVTPVSSTAAVPFTSSVSTDDARVVPLSSNAAVLFAAPAQTPGSISVRMTITEPPKVAVGPADQDDDGNWVTRAQSANVRLDITMPSLSVDLALPLVNPRAVVQLPISITAAGASGYLTAIDCNSLPNVLDVLTVPKPIGVQIHADGRAPSNPPAPAPPDPHTTTHPLLAEVRADVAIWPLPAASVPVARVRTKIDLGDAGSSATVQPEVGGPPASGAVRGFGIGGLLTPAQLEVEALGVIPINGGLVADALVTALGPTLNGLDAALDPLLRLLGVRINESDVQALSAKCERTGVKIVG